MLERPLLETYNDDDWDGHEKYSSNEEMYKTYSGYYKREVNKDSPIKIIKFELL